MGHTSKKSKFAQNRIAYIVYNNPKEAGRLISRQGYEPPKNVHDIVLATKQLVRRKGRKVVEELISMHPDRNIIIGAERDVEDSYCGACSNHSYNQEDNYCEECGHVAYTGASSKSDFLRQLTEMQEDKLEELYKTTVKNSAKAPFSNDLSEEARLVWNELRLRNKSDKESAKENQSKPTETDIETIDGLVLQPKQALIMLSLTLVAGGLLGSAWKLTR